MYGGSDKGSGGGYAYSPSFAGATAYDPGYQGSTTPASSSNVKAPLVSSSSSDTPVLQVAYRDKGFGIFFIIHFLAIVACAFSFGVPALQSDSSLPVDDPNRDALDFNAALFFRVILLSCGVGAGMSIFMLWFLSRAAGGLIKCALYTSLVVQVAMAGAMFFVSPIFGAIMLLPILFTIWYIHAVKNRIPFAAAHVEAAVSAVRAHSGVFVFAFIMLIAQSIWVSLWSLAALGIENKINNSGESSSGGSPTTNKHTVGGVVVFVMLISLLWGVQLFKYITHFVVASVTGHWFFLASPSAPVKGSIWRAFTTSFGSLSLGALIVAVLEASRRAARAVMDNAAKKQNKGIIVFLACLAMCIIGCVESLIMYLNIWAIIQIAITGHSFAQAGKEAWELFQTRGWSAIVNDDLTGNALHIASLMVGAGSAAVGAGLTYIAIPSSPVRAAVSGMAAALCFFVGMGMSGIMMSVLTSSVRTIFLCFAMNPGALAVTHPDHLAKLVSAWHLFHPTVFASCGYAAAYPVTNNNNGMMMSGGGPGAYSGPSAL